MSRAELTPAQRRRVLAGKLRPGDVAAVRRLLHLTQAEFAGALGISCRTLENWEQGRTLPNGAALALLRLATRYPRALLAEISALR